MWVDVDGVFFTVPGSFGLFLRNRGALFGIGNGCSGIGETRVRGRREEAEDRSVPRSSGGLERVSLGRMTRDGVVGGASSGSAGYRWTGSPQELHETVLEIMAGGDDGLDGGGPDNQHALISLWGVVQ